jgi:DNA polymerase-1
MIREYETLDALIEAAPSHSKKKYQSVATHVADARASRELARIRTDVPVTFDSKALEYRGPSRERCYALFSSLGFRSLVAKYAPTAESSEREDRVVGSLEDVEALAGSIREAGCCGIAAIATGTSAVDALVAGWSFSAAPGSTRYVPVAHSGLADTPNLPSQAVFERLGPVLSAPDVRKIGHDLKFATIACAREGVTLAGLDLDTMVASYLVDATRANHSMAALALERVGYMTADLEGIVGKGAKAVALDSVPPTSLAVYAGERADLPMALAPSLREDLQAEGLDAVYRDLERPLIPILADLERAGIRVDTGVLAGLSAEMQAELDGLAKGIFEHAGTEFNINSPKQLAEVLFSTLNLQSTKKTGKTRATSTAQAVLEELALVHDLPGLVLKWRSIQKLKGTYVDALPALVNPRSGRVHTTFNQAVAATGRLSSSDPNLQNIPIRTPLGRQIRAAFCAEPGRVLISADYSQIELRVLAHLSGDRALTDAFRQGIDIHDRTADRVFGTSSGLDAHELRRRAKIINYALLYGKTAFTLAKDIGVTQQAAQEFIDAYFAGYPEVRAFIDRILEDARGTGAVRTLTGRRRLVPGLNSRNGQIRMAAERETVNMPVQGTAADVLKKAMIDVSRALAEYNAGRDEPSTMILTVHDELLFEAPTRDAESVAELVRERMEQAFTLDVPLTVDVGIGDNWNAAKP